MLVRTQCKGRACTGVSVGDNVVRRYFPKRTESIDLELDHLLIRCGLSPGFWNGHSEISDPRLCAWLESKNFNWRPGEEPVALAMIPSGNNVFRLKTFPSRKTKRANAASEFGMSN
ncbi:MAG: hypothetical protein WAL75_08920 [Terracidiphilus sp.]